ncbi:uncharacterized protein I303_101473 [Kwoniella dejecticola CBS 10117]|uniref:Uncharacterized protein n=1 Tax=Kwoniella dejecticola CBS 10117 TaxID=1296121 RepID=A0A1A6ADQ8_9TREE|nr:uncharacterized protein I303_02394 [Kwoniella dejecticola CBS 10117]OBR88174.1 hypothetical protein I303_02394 [Kwoniella dejecticola CBS 10117]
MPDTVAPGELHQYRVKAEDGSLQTFYRLNTFDKTSATGSEYYSWTGTAADLQASLQSTNHKGAQLLREAIDKGPINVLPNASQSTETEAEWKSGSVTTAKGDQILWMKSVDKDTVDATDPDWHEGDDEAYVIGYKAANKSEITWEIKYRPRLNIESMKGGPDSHQRQLWNAIQSTESGVSGGSASASTDKADREYTVKSKL